MEWSRTPRGSIVAAQLEALGRMHTRVPELATQQRLATVVPQLYRGLAVLDEHDLEVARQLLQGASCIWVGDAFVPAERVALRLLTYTSLLVLA